MPNVRTKEGNPCYNCKDRTTWGLNDEPTSNCHDSCHKYSEWKVAYEATKAKQTVIDEYKCESRTKCLRKMLDVRALKQSGAIIRRK